LGDVLFLVVMKEWTDNQAVEMMLVNNTSAFRRVADFIERYEMDHEEAVACLREWADEMEAQSVVVRLRDELGFSMPDY
jgi:DNA topoisomerase VI subunit B